MRKTLKMKVLRAIAICLVVLPMETSTQLSVDPGKQAQIEKAVEATNYLAEGAEKWLTKHQKELEAAKKISKPLAGLTTSVQFLGHISKFLGPAGMALSVIFTFFADSPFDKLSQQMTQEFEQVNKKLDGIYDKFDDLEENLKDFIDAKLDINELVGYANTILNSEKKLKQLLTELKDISPGDPDYGRKKLKMMEAFPNFYEHEGVEAAIYNLVRMLDVTTARPPLKKDLFASVREEVDCDTGRMLELFNYIGMILLNGVRQNMAYIAIKKPDAVHEDPMRWFHTLQIGYQTSVLHCYNNVRKYAEEQAKKGGSSREISERLKIRYSWLNWAVGKKTEETRISGSNYFEVPRIKKNDTIVVVWQDANITAQHSVESMDGRITTKDFCSGSDTNRCLTCTNKDIFSVENLEEGKAYHLKDLNSDDLTMADNLEDLYAPEEMMRGIYDRLDERNPKGRQEIIYNSVNSYNSVFEFFGKHGCNRQYIHQWRVIDVDVIQEYQIFARNHGKNKWIVGEAPNVNNPCDELHQEDLRRGTCHNIEYTSQFFVLCNFGYQGDHCQDTLDSSKIEAELSPLKDILDERAWKGLPSLVDVLLDVRQLGDKIEGIKEVINDNTNRLSFEIQHSEVLRDLVYIIDEYDKYMSDSDSEKISGDTFLHRIHKHFSQKDISRFFYDLEDALKNKYLDYEKKKIAGTNRVCTLEYREKVKAFKMYIAMTERVLRTSLLMYINTDMYKESIEQNEAIWRDYEREIKKDFELEKYWKDGSCPVFNPSGRIPYCSETESFEGAQIQEFSCNVTNGEYPNMKRALCTRKNGTLDWDIEMSSTCQRFETSKDVKCLSYHWSDWTRWSRCTADCSCDMKNCQGRKERTRTCIGEVFPSKADKYCCPDPKKTEEVKDCWKYNTIYGDCCTNNGKWTCNDGKCISKDQLCDGTKDCSGGEDEKSSACPGVLRSHDIIGLQVKSSCYKGPKFMSFIKKKKIYLMDNRNRAENIQIIKVVDEKFSKKGDRITDGDEVAIKALWFTKGKNSWLSCPCDSHCRRESCPNNGYRSYCTAEQFRIWQVGKTGDVSRSGRVFFTRKSGCGNKKITASNFVKMFYSGLGPCEQWDIRFFKSYDWDIPYDHRNRD